MASLSEPQARAEQVLAQLVAAARSTLGADLCALVLYGSAAEQRLRTTSDVNLLFVLERFDARAIAALSPALRVAEAAVRMAPLFVLRSELPAACEAFPERFGDIARRCRLLHGGAEIVAQLKSSRAAVLRRLAQVLLNNALRVRRSYALLCLREEQAARALAEVAGPLRASAASLFELEGRAFDSPKAALSHWAERQPGQPHAAFVAALSRAHAGEPLQPGAAPGVLLEAASVALELRAAVLALVRE